MTETLNFKLISPERTLMEEPVFQVTMPGELGEFGVRRNHASLISTVRHGVVQIETERDGKVKRVFITGGIADVSGEHCLLLAEEAENVDDLDQTALEQKLSNLKEDLTLVEGDDDRKRVELDIMLTRARIEAVTGLILPC